MNLNQKKILEHFNKISIKYKLKTESFPWKFLKEYERSALVKELNLTEPKYVLDLGTGSGYYSRYFANKNHTVYAVDISNKMINHNKQINKNITFICDDASKVKIKKKFDIIIAAGLLEFVVNPNLILNNAKLHSKRNTNLIILLPRQSFFGIFYKINHLLNGIKINIYNQKKLKQMIENSEWQIVNIKKIFPFSYVIKLKIN